MEVHSCRWGYFLLPGVLVAIDGDKDRDELPGSASIVARYQGSHSMIWPHRGQGVRWLVLPFSVY